MLSLMNRRHLLTAAAAACGVPLLANKSATTAEPITRNRQAKFKFSLAAYSYRDLLKSGKLTLADFIADCAKFGLEGTELTSYYFPADVSDQALCHTRALCFRLGLDVSGTAVGNDFGIPPGEQRDKQLADVKLWIDRAALLGAPVIRIFAGHVKPKQDPAIAHRLMVGAMEECCAYAGEKGIFLALENHGGPTATADGLLKLVRDVNNPWLGVNLDSGNFHSADVYAEFARVAPYALNVQVKVVTSGPDKVKVPTDYAKLNKILRDSGYRGYVVLEYEENGDPREECPKHLDQLRNAFRA